MRGTKIISLIRKDSVQAIGLKYCGIFLAFVAQAAMLKFSTTEIYGVYIQILAMANILGTVCSLGQLTYLTKNISIWVSRDNYEKAIEQAGNSILVSLLCILPVSLICVAVNMLFQQSESDKVTVLSIQWSLLLLVPVIAWQRVVTGFARGSGQAIRDLALNHVVKPVLQLVVILFLALYFSETKISSEILLSILAFSLYGIVIFQLFSVISVYKKKVSLSTFASAVSSIKLGSIYLQVKSSLTFTGMSLITVLEKSVDVLIVGFTLDAAAAGVYGFITRLYRITTAAQASLNAVFASKSAKDHAQKNTRSFTESIKTMTFINVASAGVFLVFFLVAGQAVLTKVNAEMSNAWIPLIILSVSGVIRAAAGPVSMTSNMVGAEKLAIKITIVTLITGIILMFLLTSWYGIVGTAVAAAIMGVGRAWLLRHMLGRYLLSSSNTDL